MDTGDLEVSIDNAPFEQVSVFVHYFEAFNRPKVVMFAGNLALGAHTLDVKVSSGKHEKSKGTAIRILRLLVN